MNSLIQLSNNWLIIVILLIVLVFLRILANLWLRKNKFPYALKKYYLTQAELAFLKILREAVGLNYEIVPQVSLKSIVKVKDNNNYYTYQNKIDRKILDFVLFSKSDFNPLLIVELDDSSHQQSERIDRDKFIDKVAEVTKLPILHVPVKYSYNVNELRNQIDLKINLNK